MFRRGFRLVVACLLLAACSDTTADTTSTSVLPTTTSSTTPASTIPDLREDLETAEQTLSDLQAQIEELEAELTQADNARREAESARDEALAELEELRLAYDDEIQQVLANGVTAVVDSSCSAIEEPLDDQQVAELIDRQVSEWAQQPGLPDNAADSLDREAIESQVAECVATVEEQARQAELTEPKGDGFYTVGEEIAAGTWESQGTSSDCYWARLDANQELIDNHFGNAGGRVTIRSSDAEVEFSGCGTWEYQG